VEPKANSKLCYPWHKKGYEPIRIGKFCKRRENGWVQGVIGLKILFSLVKNNGAFFNQSLTKAVEFKSLLSNVILLICQ